MRQAANTITLVGPQQEVGRIGVESIFGIAKWQRHAASPESNTRKASTAPRAASGKIPVGRKYWPMIIVQFERLFILR